MPYVQVVTPERNPEPLGRPDLVLPDTLPRRFWPQTYHSDFEKDDAELNTYVLSAHCSDALGLLSPQRFVLSALFT